MTKGMQSRRGHGTARRLLSAGCGALVAIASTGLILAVSPQAASAVSLWSPQTSPVSGSTLNSVDFVNDNDGWAVDNEGDVLHTTDGGTHWNIQASLGTALSSVSFGTTQDGIVTTTATNGVVYYTTDGGTDWTLIQAAPANQLTGVSLVNASDGWAVGSLGGILATTDGGATWAADSSPTGVYLTGVDFVNDNDGWAVGDGGTIVQTVNGGTTWTLDNSGTTQGLTSVSFTDASHGHAVGDNGTILSTTDGGLTWEPQTSTTTQQLNGVTFPTDSVGWAVGFGDTILGTSDNGATWVPENDGTAFALFGVSAPDATHAWTVGEPSAASADPILAYTNPNANPVTQFAITPSATTVTAGSTSPQLTVTVTAEDVNGNVVPGYLGTVQLTSSDPQATLPADATLTNGVGTFDVTLKSATQPEEPTGPADQTISVNDVATPSIHQMSAPIEVDPAAATHLAFTGFPWPGTAFPTTGQSGSGVNFVVSALDPYGNLDTNLPNTDPIIFSTTDPAGLTPPIGAAGLSSGQQDYYESFTTAGPQTVSATDLTQPSITGTSPSILITPAAATKFVFSVPSSVTAGAPFTFTVTAEDGSGNVDTGYAGTVSFTGLLAGQTITPASGPLTNGTGTFTGTYDHTGTFDITATDGVVTNSSSTFNVDAAGATQFVVTAPTDVTAGSGFTFSVTAKDAFGDTDTSFNGVANLTSTDTKADLPFTATLVNGVATGINGTLFTATQPEEASGPADQTISATEGSIVGTSAAIEVDPAGADTLDIVTPPTATAGVAFGVTVTALDPYGNVDTTFFRDEAAAFFEGPTSGVGLAFTNGVAHFNADITSAGSQVVQAIAFNICFGICDFVGGTSAPIAVSAAAATSLVFSNPSTVTAGAPFSFTVTAVDTFGNVATGDNDPLHFTSTDPQAVLPANSPLSNGVGTFSATLKTATFPPETHGTGVASETITATDTVTPSITGTSDPVVTPGPATHLVLIAPATATAGSSFPSIVQAEDAYGNIATSDNDTVHFTSSDGTAVLPPDTALVAGWASVNTTLKKAGTDTLTVRDPFNSESATASIVVSAISGGTDKLIVTAPATATAGVPFTATVTAEDSLGNLDPTYTGPVTLSTSDTADSGLPANVPLTAGVGTLSVTLVTAGSQTITASGPTAVSGSAGIVVSPGPVNHLAIVPSTTGPTAGVAMTVTVTAEDAFDNTVTSFDDNVGITSTDPQAVLPPNAHLSSGVGVFSVTLDTAGSQTITATDVLHPALTVTTPTLTVVAAAASQLLISAPATSSADASFNATVTAEDPFGNVAKSDNGAIRFSTSSAQSVLPGTVNLTMGVGTFPITLETAGLQTLTATTRFSTPILSASTSVLVTAGAAVDFVLSAPPTEMAGVPTNVTVTAQDDHGNTVTTYANKLYFYSTTQHHPRPTLPEGVTLTGGVGTFQVTFTLTGNQDLTAVSHPSSGKIFGSTTILVTPAPAASFTIAAPATVVTHAPFNFTVTAFDQFGNIDTLDNNFIQVHSSDAAATLPNNVALSGGIGTFSATLDTVGPQTLTATDYINSALTATANITVLPGPAVTYVVTGAPPYVVTGTPFALTVTAYDAWGNVATTYTGTVHFTSSDPAVVLPANSTLSSGVGTFTFVLKTIGTQSITATDTVTPSITGSATTVVVNPPPTAGYVLAGSDGGNYALGAAAFEGSVTNPINAPVVGVATTKDGLGYWDVASDGGIFTFGDANFYGSTGALKLNQPIVGMARTADGKGYWLVAADGGVFSFGDAAFYGSTGSLHLNQPIVGMATTPDGKGYLLVAADGGIFTFGDANFDGSLGNLTLNQPIVGMATTPSGNGYWLVAKDGGTFTFGDAQFFGSLPASVAETTQNPSQAANVYDVVGIAATSDHRGYWIVERDATVHPFGDATPFGPPLNNAGFAPNNIAAISAEP